MIKIFATTLNSDKNLRKAFITDVLSIVTGMSKNNIIINTTEKGKPLVNNTNLYFNVSHSGIYHVVAISEKPIGIDIEIINNRDYKAILERFFSAEENECILNKNEEEQLEYFISLWTLKEAFLKYKGTGLSGGIAKYPIIIKDNIISIKNHNVPQLYFKQYEIDKRYKLSVCGEENNFAEKIIFI